MRAQDAAFVEQQTDLFDGNAFFFQFQQGGFADEIAAFVFQINRPTHACFERAGVVVHIVAVEVHAGFHAQGVARAEAAGLYAGLLQGFEECDGFGAGQDDFDAVFAGVAGAGDKPVITQIHALEWFQVVDDIRPFGFDGQEFFNGFRALHGKHTEVVTRVEGDAEFLSDFVELGGVFFAGRAVGYDAVLGFGFVGAVNDQVVNHAAVVVEQRGIKGFADEGEFGNVVGNQFAEKGFGVRSGDIGNEHMGYVEHACVGAHGFVFGDLRTIMDGQLPAGKIDQLRACILMGLVKRGGFQGSHSQLLRIYCSDAVRT